MNYATLDFDFRSWGNDGGYWLGAEDLMNNNNTFVWHGGVAMSYRYWGSDQPNNAPAPQDCLIGTPGEEHKWQDKSCLEDRYFLCEYQSNG